ncbi:MAG: hypothetical protein AAGL69_08240 [Pseudomonadota bacterium]
MTKERIVFYGLSGKTTQASPIARFLTAVAGAGVFALALLVGGALFLILLALALAFGVVLALRAWWWRRKNPNAFSTQQGARDSGAEILDVEYSDVSDRKKR